MNSLKIYVLTLILLSFILADVNIPLNNPNIGYEGVWFPVIDSNRVIFNRHTEDVLTNWESGISSTSKVFAYTQTGIRIRFSTSSPTIKMTFELRDVGGKMGLKNGFAVYADSSLLSIHEDLEFTIESPNPGYLVNYEMTLPSMHAVNFIRMTLEDGYSLADLPPNNLLDYVAIGNSITHGTGHQSATFLTYPFLMAQEMGWDLTNLAVAGARTGWPIAQLFKGQQADFITILLGFNDWMWDNKNLQYKMSQYTKLLDTLRYYQPKAKIFCITPLATAATTPQYQVPFTLEQLRTAIDRTVTRRASASDPNLFLIHGDSLSNTTMLMDGIHFSEIGTPQFAYNLAVKIKDILASSVYIEKSFQQPKSFRLNRIYPNPFNPDTEIEYELSQSGRTQIEVYDLSGRKIKELIDRQQFPGNYKQKFAGKELSSGVYFIKLQQFCNGYNETAIEKCLLIK